MGDDTLNILWARDISLSGLGVQVPHGFRDADLERELDLVITLPGTRSFLARGVVRHANNVAVPNYFGVELTSLRTVHRDEVRKFIDRLKELEAREPGA